MVQIRQSQERAPRTFKFWGRVKFRIRRRRQRLKEGFNDSRRSFNNFQGEDGQHGVLFDFQSLGARKRKGILRFSHRWGLAGTCRWLCLARSKFLLRENARVSWTVNTKKRDKHVQEALTGSDCKSRNYTERSWGLERRRGKVKISTWMNGRGGRSLRAPLIGEPQGGEHEVAGKRKEDGVEDGCCGCSGGMMWRPREKFRKEIEEVGELEGLKIEEVGELEGLKIEENALAIVDDQAALPDDIVEMCLARTPFASLIRARAVCRKWKSLTSSPHFFQLRESIRSWDPWLFLFGLSRNGVCLGQIQALDPASSRWHTIKADVLTGRLSYSVTAVNGAIYVVGGCSSILPAATDASDKESLKTLKTVLLYTPLTGSWRKAGPLTTGRAAPIVGMFKVKGRKGRRAFGREYNYGDTRQSEGNINLNWTSDLHCEQSSPGKRRVFDRGSRHGGELAVYGGAETEGRELDALERNGNIPTTEMKRLSQGQGCARVLEAEFKKLDVQGSNRVAKEQRTFGLIAVGGQGTWNEQLDSAEIYDPVTDNWQEIASLPADHGTPCAGVVCKNFFYVYSESNKLAAYDLEQEVWHSIGVSQAPTRLLDYTPKLVSCRDRIFLLGVTWGMISEDGSEMATRTIWELHQEPTSTGWVNVSQHPDAPLDWNAVFVADEEIIFGVEMFKIFGQMLDFVTVCKISGSGGMAWERGSRMEMAMHEMDPSSCLTKTAIVVRL